MSSKSGNHIATPVSLEHACEVIPVDDYQHSVQFAAQGIVDPMVNVRRSTGCVTCKKRKVKCGKCSRRSCRTQFETDVWQMSQNRSAAAAAGHT